MNRPKYNDIPNCVELYAKQKRELEALKVNEEFNKTIKALINASEKKKRELVRVGLLKDE